MKQSIFIFALLLTAITATFAQNMPSERKKPKSTKTTATKAPVSAADQKCKAEGKIAQAALKMVCPAKPSKSKFCQAVDKLFAELEQQGDKDAIANYTEGSCKIKLERKKINQQIAQTTAKNTTTANNNYTYKIGIDGNANDVKEVAEYAKLIGFIMKFIK